MTILINTRQVYWQKPTITYDDILLFLGHRLETVATVTYSYPREAKVPDGSMFRGMSIPSADGLIINCAITNNA